MCGKFFISEEQIDCMRKDVIKKKAAMDEHFTSKASEGCRNSIRSRKSRERNVLTPFKEADASEKTIEESEIAVDDFMPFTEMEENFESPLPMRNTISKKCS